MLHPVTYSIKPVLINKPNAKGLCPVKLVIIVDRKRTVISTGIRVQAYQWKDERVVNHIEADSHNAYIQKKLSEYRQKLSDLRLTDQLISVESFSSAKKYKVVDYFNELIKQLQSKHEPGTIKNYRYVLNKIETFDKGATFASIDPAWLRRFESVLRKSLEDNTTHKVFSVLRMVFNAANNDEITSNYPFKKFDIPKYTDPDKVYLTEKEIMLFWNTLKENPFDIATETAGYYFLLGCFSGLRVSDWLRFNKDSVKDGRLKLYAKKNGNLITMKLNTRLKKIVTEVLKRDKVHAEQKINVYIKGIAKIAKIHKDISTHTARRSFATLCASKGISPAVTAELMGVNLRTVMIYYKLTGQLLDSEVKKLG